MYILLYSRGIYHQYNYITLNRTHQTFLLSYLGSKLWLKQETNSCTSSNLERLGKKRKITQNHPRTYVKLP